MGKVAAENKTVKDSISQLHARRAGLIADIEGRDRTIRIQGQQRDSLQKQLQISATREKALGLDVIALQNRIDSLARVRVPEGDQARYLKEQRMKLDQLEKDLDARDITTTDREKLQAQRESVLQRKEADFAAQENLFKDREEREKRVQVLEQQPNARE